MYTKYSLCQSFSLNQMKHPNVYIDTDTEEHDLENNVLEEV